jgi:putative inorganic carbon (HCO3(-)) transporter
VQLKGLFTFLLPLLVAGLVDDEDDAGLLLDALRLTALWLVGRGLVDYFLGGHDNVWDRAAGGLSHYMTYAGLLMVLALAFAARALSSARPRAQRLADGAVAAAAALLVGLTFTRSAALGLAAGAVVLLSPVRPRPALAVALAAAALLAVSPGRVRERLSSSFDLRDDAARDRVAMWVAGASMIGDRPFLGVGPGRVGYLYPVYRRPGFVDARVGHLHNNVVHTAAETGLPSALAYLAFVALAAAAAWPLARDASRPGVQALARGALAVNAALFVAGLFEYNFGDVEVQRAMLVLLALPFAASRAPAPDGAPAS